MDNITQIAKAMQEILTKEADKLGKSSEFIKRRVKMTGSGFIQTLVFGFQSNPDLTYGEMSQSAATVGIEMSAQGIEQRFNERAAKFLQQVLEKVVQEVVVYGKRNRASLIERFTGIYIRDSSVIELPRELKNIWRGSGGSCGENAALKLQVNLNYSTGELDGPVLQDGRSQDQTSPFQKMELPAGSLQLADLGFFNLDRFNSDNEAQVYWISRWKTGTAIFLEDGKRLDLLNWLQKQQSVEIDRLIFLGTTRRIPCRLLIQRVPQEVVDQRRRRMREETRKQGQPATAERLALANWTIIITNAPIEKISLREAFIFVHIRWQIELLFKLWKSHAKIDEWRSKNPWRIMCEIYAKLIGVVINQWIFVASLWQYPERSLFRAAKTIQKFSTAMAISLQEGVLLVHVLTCLEKCLESRCQMETRKKHPASFQLLFNTLEVADVLC